MSTITNLFDQADAERLTTQLARVRHLMSDGRWRTLSEIVHAIGGGSEAGVSARLRQLRRPDAGGYHVERRRRQGAPAGTYEYQLRP